MFKNQTFDRLDADHAQFRRQTRIPHAKLFIDRQLERSEFCELIYFFAQIYVLTCFLCLTGSWGYSHAKAVVDLFDVFSTFKSLISRFSCGLIPRCSVYKGPGGL